MKKKSRGDKIIVVVFLIFLAFLVGWAINKGIKLDEENECLKWQKQAKENSAFYITPNQKIGCDFIGIRINAPVKGGE